MAKREKTGGRQQGTPNKLTKEIRESLKDIVNKEIQGLEERLSKLNDKDRIDFLLKIAPYVLPKVNDVSPLFGEPDEFKIQELHL